jgi:hypothetical protein
MSDRFGFLRVEGYINQKIRGVWTGELRPPKKGEYYISGAIPQAYKAHGNLACSYHIAKLVEVEEKTVTTTTILREL